MIKNVIVLGDNPVEYYTNYLRRFWPHVYLGHYILPIKPLPECSQTPLECPTLDEIHFSEYMYPVRGKWLSTGKYELVRDCLYQELDVENVNTFLTVAVLTNDLNYVKLLDKLHLQDTLNQQCDLSTRVRTIEVRN